MIPTAFASSNHFEDGKKFFDLKKYEKSKLSLYQSIIFNPEAVDAYIYLAKNDLKLNNLILGILKRMEKYFLIDPYANSFNKYPDSWEN